jgi:hypothetical protein
MPLSSMSIACREFGLTALAKLFTRFENCFERIHALIRQYSANINLELQQRSVEYAGLLLKDDLRFFKFFVGGFIRVIKKIFFKKIRTYGTYASY